jgi:hypothetical protein
VWLSFRNSVQGLVSVRNMVDEKSMPLKAVPQRPDKGALMMDQQNSRLIGIQRVAEAIAQGGFPLMPGQLKLAIVGASIERHPSCRSLRLARSNANQFPPLVEGWS